MPLKVSDGIGAYIDDFQKSDAPQFKGKSKKERRDMAIAAYLTAKRGGKPQEENVKSADRKPEIYTKPDGKKGVRMVATDREVVKAEAYTMGKPVEKKKKDVGEKTYMRTDSKLKNLKVPVTRKKGKVIKPEFKLASTKREALDAKDKPFVKDLVKKLRGGSKTHAKQADDLEKAMKENSVNEISDTLKMKYRDKAKDTMRLKRAQMKSISKSAYAGATDKEKERASKRADSIMTSIRLRSRPKGESVKEEMNFAVSIEGLPTMFMSADSPGMLKQTLRKIVKQPSMIQSVKRVTDAKVKKTFRLKAQGREEEDE